MHTLLNDILIWIDSSKYVLLFLGSIVEGPVLMVSSGFLYHQGQLAFWPMLFALFFGNLCADIGWYILGYFGANKVMKHIGPFFNITPPILEKIRHRFYAYQTVILWVSKLTMGFGFAIATLLVAGMLRVPFKKYLTINVVAGVIWVFLALSIGYLFGNVYNLIPGELKAAFVLIGLIMLVLAIRAVNRVLVTAKFGDVA